MSFFPLDTQGKNTIMRFICLLLLALLVTDASADGPRKIALLIGVSDYQNRNVEDLQYAENDIRVVGSQLKLMGFEVNSLVGEKATRTNTISLIDDFMDQASELESGDIVFLMFSGHGQQIQIRQQSGGDSKIIEIPYFCPVDSLPYDSTKLSTRGMSEFQVAEKLNFVSMNRVLRGLDEMSNSLNNLLVVDACRNNPSKGKSAGISGTSATVPRGVNILFAAGSGQKSWESTNDQVEHGVFTHFLIRGLQGEAKNTRDQVTWSRLASYLQDEVAYSGPELAGNVDRIQNPHSIINSTNLIVLGEATSDALIEKRLYESLRHPNDVIDIAEMCSDKEFVYTPVYAAMMLGDKECCRRGLEILRPQFNSPEFIKGLGLSATIANGNKKVEAFSALLAGQFFGTQDELLAAIDELEPTSENRFFRIASRLAVAYSAFSNSSFNFDSNRFSKSKVSQLEALISDAKSDLEKIDKDSLSKNDQALFVAVEKKLAQAKSNRDQYRKQIKVINLVGNPFPCLLYTSDAADE